MLCRTLPLSRMASTAGGMRRILKNKGTVSNYIRQAVETGVYRTQEELEQVWKERRESADDLRVIMRRFRQDIVRGVAVQDYPVEYLILQQHPPVPDPPRTPRKLLKKMQAEPNPTEQLVRKYFQRQRDRQTQANDATSTTTEDYYRRLLGVPAPPVSSALGKKSAAIQKAYAAAIHHYQLERMEGLSESEALAQVDALLAQQDVTERHVSRERTKKVQEARRSDAPETMAHLGHAVQQPQDDESVDSGHDTTTASSTAEQELDSIASIFHASPRTVEAMMRWSERLAAVPYREWTVGASTALDHWIARQLLGMSEETWLALLEGDDPSLLSRGRDIVAVRESLFPETRLDLEEEEEEEEEEMERDEADTSAEKSIDELLASLGGLNAPSEEDTLSDIWKDVGSDDSATRDEALTSTDEPMISRDDAEAFWSQLQDEELAIVLLDTMRQDGPPPGASFLQQAFWDLPYPEQLERLMNLGAIRPLLDEYTEESERLRFLQRHGDTILAGVYLEHLVYDPDGPIKASDIGGNNKDVPTDARFRLEMRPYHSVGDVSAEEKSRALYKAWNQHKAGRANYEERLFQTGRLGLRYTDKILSDQEFDEEDED